MFFTDPPLAKADVSPKIVVVIESSAGSKEAHFIKARLRIASIHDSKDRVCIVEGKGRVVDGSFVMHGPTSTFTFHQNPQKDKPTEINPYVEFLEITNSKKKRLLQWGKKSDPIATLFAWKRPTNFTYYINISGLDLGTEKIRVQSSGVM